MKELLIKLSEFRKEVPIFKKDTKGYGYKYATLDSIWEVITPLLAEKGLMILQSSEPVPGKEELLTIRTELILIEDHKQSILSRITIPVSKEGNMGLYQSVGSGITYMRRYSLALILGLITEEDKDGDPGMPELKPGTKAWTAAVDHIAGGGSIEDIEKQFRISPTNKKKL